MKTLTDIPIFQAGRHRDMSGAAVTITEVELQKTVSIYQPSLHEAPLVIGHPQHDAPAWGWVAGLRVEKGMLLASVKQVDPAFSAIVTAGRYKKVSASFYTPDAANNPAPGTFYLRHVGFLGAQPPAIKGLTEASFNEKETGIITISKNIFPQNKQQNNSNEFSEYPTKQEAIMEPEQKEKKVDEQQKKQPEKQTKEQLAPTKEELEKQQQDLKAREDELTKREEKINNQERDNKKQRMGQLIDQLIKEGRVLPRDKEGLLALLDRLDTSGVIEFSEGEGEAKKSEAASYFQSFIKRLPVQVEFAETTPTTQSYENNNLHHYTTPRGYQVDKAGLTTHNKILAYAKSHEIDYLTAALSIDK
ncbi:MAG: hypothetical protein HQL71_02980 [Magnetococcales bacterium]|nr:hypothetical protein [Magnetococcales bacterium]